MLVLNTMSMMDMAVYAALAFCAYAIGLVAFRLFLSPLRAFPGPKLAAATFWCVETILNALLLTDQREGMSSTTTWCSEGSTLSISHSSTPNMDLSSVSTRTSCTSMIPSSMMSCTLVAGDVAISGTGPLEHLVQTCPHLRPSCTRSTEFVGGL